MVKKILALSINDTRLYYVLIKKERSGWRVVCAGQYNEPVILTQSNSLSQAIESILTKEKILPRDLFLSVANKEAFIHQITTPLMSSREIKGVVLNEIERNPDLGNRVFDYIYRVFPYKVEQQKVLFAALPQETIDSIIDELSKTKLNCHSLEVSPYSLRDIILEIEKSEPEQQEKTSGYLAVYKNYSYFAIFDKENYQVFYKIALGIDDLTSSNSLKQEESSLFFNQLQRIIKSYTSNHRAQPLSSLWVLWDNEQVKDLDQTLSLELGLKAKILNMGAIKNFVLANDTQLNPIYMLAVVPMIHHIWHIKSETKKAQLHFLRSMHISRLTRKYTLGIVLIITLLTFLYAGFNYYIDTKITPMQSNITSVEQKTKDLKNQTRDLFEQYADYKQTRQRILQQATYLRELNRISWSQVLAIVSQEMPEDLALTSFKFTGGRQSIIKGDAYHMETISNLIRKIDTSSILEKGNFDNLREKSMRRSSKEEPEKFYQFGITARLRVKGEISDDIK